MPRIIHRELVFFSRSCQNIRPREAPNPLRNWSCREVKAVQITRRQKDRFLVVGIHGELDRSSVEPLEHALLEHLDSGRSDLIIDLQNCTFIDSSGIAAMFMVLQGIGDKHILALVGPNSSVARLLEVVGLIGAPNVEVFPDMEAASAGLSSVA